MSKRAQAAMEFLMTYGWAILVVLAAIGALAYFGVLSPSNLLPEKCEFPSGLTCTETASTSVATDITTPQGDTATAPAICFPVTNTLGYDVTGVTVVDEAGDCSSLAGVDISNGASRTLCVQSCTTAGIGAGKKYSYNLEIQYTSADTGLTRAATGRVSGKWAS
jgi:hypothetical protein